MTRLLNCPVKICLYFSNGAKLFHCKYWSKVFNQEIGYLIYLPEKYSKVSDSVFPVLYLHDTGDNYAKDTYKIESCHESMNDYFPQTVIVFVNAVTNNFYTEEPEVTIINELIPHIVSTYRVSDQGKGIESYINLFVIEKDQNTQFT